MLFLCYGKWVQSCKTSNDIFFLLATSVFTAIYIPQKNYINKFVPISSPQRSVCKACLPSLFCTPASACPFCFGCSTLPRISSPCVDFKVVLGSSCIFCKSGCKQVRITHVILLCPPPFLFRFFFRFILASKIIPDPFKDPVSYFPASSKWAT